MKEKEIKDAESVEKEKEVKKHELTKNHELRSAGRPRGATNKFSAQTIEQARAAGMLPQDFLLKIVRNEAIEHTYNKEITDKDGNIIERIPVSYLHYASFSERREAATAILPYFCAKLAPTVVELSDEDKGKFKTLMSEIGKSLK